MSDRSEAATPTLLVGPDHVECWPDIVSALRAIVAEGRWQSGQSAPTAADLEREVVLPIRGAARLSRSYALPKEAVGRIAAQLVGAVPRGSAILQLGERIRHDTLDYLLSFEADRVI